MRKYLMAGVATAALMLGLNQAMAQSSMSGGAEKQPGATSSNPSTGTSGTMDHSKSEGSKTIGQARDQAEPKGMEPSSKVGGSDMKADQKVGAGAVDETKRNAQRDTDKATSKTTIGQARDEMKSEKGAASHSAGKMGAQPKANENDAQTPSSSSTTKMGRQPSTNQNSAQGLSSSGATTGSASSSATQLTTEQRTEVREKVLVNAPREDNVNFSVNVGTVVPSTVRVVTVPETLIRIHPEWRGHRFFVVHDEIIIVNNDFRIIAVLPV
jgi:Protein of unknown function (DUF1236)